MNLTAEAWVLLLIPTLAAAVASAFVARRWPFWTLATVLFLLLFHEWVVKELTFNTSLGPVSVQAFSLWKDGAILGLAFDFARRYLSRIRRVGLTTVFNGLGLLDVSFAIVVAIGLVAVLLSPNRLAAVAAFRDYYQPLVFFLFAQIAVPGRIQFRRFSRIWLVFGWAMALLGLWQLTAWDAETYARFGFGPAISDWGIPPLDLGAGLILRPPSTVSGPNELGMHMLILLALAIWWILESDRRWAIVGFISSMLFGLMLVFTYSRGVILALPISIGVLVLLRLAKRVELARTRIIVALLPLVVTAAASFSSGLWGFVVDTAANLETDYHIVDTMEAVSALVKMPQGVGMGLVGPRIGQFFPTEVAFHVEGSLFQIAFDMSVLGAVAWTLFFVAGMWQAWKAYQRSIVWQPDVVSVIALSGWTGSVVSLLFIPIMQSLTMMAWLWTFMGWSVARARIDEIWADGHSDFE